MANEIEREISRLSNLKQHKGLAPEELEPIARLKIEIRKFKANPLFPDKKEQEMAETRFKEYLENNEIDNASDIDNLKSLIFNEIFEIRIQKQLNEMTIPNERLTKQLVSIQDQKNGLKLRLGIDKKDNEQNDLSALQLLQKRVKKYINENKNEFSLWIPWTCEKCGYKDIEPYLIYKRVKDFQTMPHGWFAGRYLFNYEIIKDVKDGKITKEQATKYLMCAGQGNHYKLPAEDKKWCEDYVNYCLENFTEITDLLKKN